MNREEEGDVEREDQDGEGLSHAWRFQKVSDAKLHVDLGGLVGFDYVTDRRRKLLSLDPAVVDNANKVRLRCNRGMN